jgi:uncharacterized protein (DUF1330 family)
MTIYVISAINKKDERLYAEYESDAYASVQGHDGIEILAFSDDVRGVEGVPPGRRMVLMRVADQETFDRWYASPGYQAAKAKRLAASDTRFTVILES